MGSRIEIIHINDSFTINNISSLEMFYFVEKAYESFKRWVEDYNNGKDYRNPSEHPLFNFLVKIIDPKYEIKGCLQDLIRQILEDNEIIGEKD